MKLYPGMICLFLFSCLVANFGCEKEKTVDPGGNSPPTIASANILPEKPNKESTLSLMIQNQGPERQVVTYQYQWVKNEEEIPGATAGMLKNDNYGKGDMIRVRVRPSEGGVEGRAFLSEPVRILNSPPVIREIWIEPRWAYVTSSLKANVKCSDVDGDPIYYTYQWEKNGTVLSEERNELLEKGRFKRGDSITVTVTPDDREASGTPRKSEPIIISNGPPVIVSFPPTAVQGTTYIYQVKANDPDDDSVSFTLKTGPKGMGIEDKTGLIRWEIRKEDQGSHLIEILASDSEGATSFQRYTLTVEYRQSPESARNP